MLKCKACEVRDKEINFLREQIEKMTDKLIALTSPLALSALRPDSNSNEYYGSGEELTLGWNEFGESVPMEKKTEQ